MALGRAPRHGISNPGLGLDFRRFESLVTPGGGTTRPRAAPARSAHRHGRAAGSAQADRSVSGHLRDVAAAHPEARFLILGDGPERSRLDQLVHRHGLSDRVQFLPYLPNSADVVKYFRALDIFTLPTEREGFGMVFAEAMAAETPVVGPDMSPINDIILEPGHRIAGAAGRSARPTPMR